MLAKIAESRVAMGFTIMAVFFVLFCVSPPLVVAVLWFGACVELIGGLYKGTQNVLSISYTIFLIIYMSCATYCLYCCIMLDFWGCYVLTQFIGTSDTSQYFVGKNFGSIRPFKYSPKKSVEGYVGGLFFAFVALRITCPAIDFSTCILLTLSGMVGDMLASFWKRLVQIKDSGTVFGSHGGFLDRFDSHACTFLFVGYLYELKQVIPYEPSTMLYPLYAWILFCAAYLLLKYMNKQS